MDDTSPSPTVIVAAKAALVAAGVTISLTIAMIAFGGAAPPAAPDTAGFASAIVAFELARTPADVFAALGPLDADAVLRAGIERVVLIDFAYLLAYPALALMLVLYVARRTDTSRVAMPLAVLLTVATSLGDAMENLTLLTLLRAVRPEDVTADVLARLDVTTCTKWSAFFLCGALLASLASLGALRARSVALGVAAVSLSAGAVAGLVGLFARDVGADLRALVEHGMNAVIAGWLVVALHAARTVWRARARTT